MRNVKLLDCTLRDGGRLIDCAFSDAVTGALANGLERAGVDIIELGFIRNLPDDKRQGTFFTHPGEMRPFAGNDEHKSLHVAFVDYGLFSVDALPLCRDTPLDGIRFGFTHKDAARAPQVVKQLMAKGYKVFVQSVNNLQYSEEELLVLIEWVNALEPYSFGIVDTYGAMYEDDLIHFFNLVDTHLSPRIAIDFHSHNNFLLSFSLAQKVIELAGGRRELIIDATLGGMGKGAGNLHTELMVDYLSRKKSYPYDLDTVLDLCDEYILPLKNRHYWGYSLPSFMAGVFKSHPNNVAYLSEKLRMGTKDLKNILGMIDEEKRTRYDYDNIENLYIEYFNHKVDDAKTIARLQALVAGRSVLVMAPGHTLVVYAKQLQQLAREPGRIVITVNHVNEDYEESIAFFGNPFRYHTFKNQRQGHRNVMITSNIKSDDEKDWIIDYYGVIKRGWTRFDNSVIMLLRLLLKTSCGQIALAGFDGYRQGERNYQDPAFNEMHGLATAEEANREIGEMLQDIMLQLGEADKLVFETPSLYKEIL